MLLPSFLNQRALPTSGETDGTSACAPLLIDHGDDKQEALRDILPEAIHVQDDKPVLENAQQDDRQHANDRDRRADRLDIADVEENSWSDREFMRKWLPDAARADRAMRRLLAVAAKDLNLKGVRKAGTSRSAKTG